MRTLAEFMEERGEQKGVLKGQRKLLLGQLRKRFGQLPAEVVARIEAGDAEALERWSEDFVEAHSLEEIFFNELTASR